MAWCNRFEIHYLFNDIQVSLLFILTIGITLYEHSCLTSLGLYMTWVRYKLHENPSHGFFTSKWLVHSQFMNLGNPLEVVVYLLIWRIASFGQWVFHGECTNVYDYILDRT